MPIRSERALLTGLALYAVLILGSQASMSIGIGILLGFAFYAFGGAKALWNAVVSAAREPEMARYLRATNLITLACFLSLLFAHFTPVVIGGMKPEVNFLKDMWKAWYFYWPLMTVPCVLALSLSSRRRLIQIFLAAFAVVSVIGCAQYFTGWPRPQSIPGTNRFHVTVFPGHHLSFASIAIFPFFMAVAECFEPKWIKRSWAIPLAIVGGLAIFGTYSRQVWLSLPIGLFISAVVSLPKRAAIAAFISGVLLIIGLMQVPMIHDRAMNGMGIGERVELWKINTEFFKLRPLTGIGWHHNLQMAGAYYHTYRPEIAAPFVGHAHSNFFEFLGGLGLCGVAAYFFWTWTNLRQAYRAGAGFFAAWVVFHLNGLTQVNLWESKVMHSMMWSIALILVVLITRREEEAGRK
ncbi:MAG: O-antigen ligase family protein [Cryobacterium sp.]|nr:O-antigen ligase family protein [Oligoflexia bacterium]